MPTDLKFTIGDKVIVSAKVKMGYDRENNRRPEIEMIEPIEAIVIGAVRRPKGKYKPFRMCDDEEDPPYLDIKGNVVLYQVRTKMFQRPIETMPEYVSEVPNAN